MSVIRRNVGTAARLDEDLALDALAAHVTPTRRAQTVDLPDTPGNDRAFGRPSTDRGVAAWPQARVVGRVE